MMIDIILFFLFFLFFTGGFFFVGFLIHFHKYKYYRKVYNQLPNMKFIRVYTNLYGLYNVVGQSSPIPYRDFIYFIDGSFCLSCKNSIYLHKYSIIPHIDIYSYYWLLKYKRWFKNNIEIRKLILDPDEFRQQQIDNILYVDSN